jgi:hypothetical protein
VNEMSVSVIATLHINDKWVDQLIDTSNDAVYFSESGKTFLTVDSGGYTTKQGEAKCLGKFSLIKNLWHFCFFNDNFKSITECDKITTPMYDLLDAEMYVVKELIKQNVLEV